MIRAAPKPTGRLAEYGVAAALVALAVVISPIGIKFFTHRDDLTFRVNTVSLVFVVFILVVVLSILARGRVRRAGFYVMAFVFPFALLAGVEALAISIHLADRIAPLENPAVMARKGPWPGHLFSEARFYQEGGLKLYRPWQGDGITLNKIGLRTAMPTPKAPGEWRVAVSGGSAVWGWRVVDADTIPVQLEQALHRAGHPNVTVYNFGIEGATLAAELALLKRFRQTYAIDEAVFYTGGNNAIHDYLTASHERGDGWTGNSAAFELMKVMQRLLAMRGNPSPELVHRYDTEVVQLALKRNSLGADTAAAAQYCRETSLRCDFVLQPMLLERKAQSGPDARMARIFKRLFPRFNVLTERVYQDALATGPASRVHDFTHIFDQSTKPYFLGLIHVSEAANRMAAAHLAPIVVKRLVNAGE